MRDESGQWNPKMQRPELWDIYNGKINKGENVRVFPISNWTELDIWNYIKREKIALPSIYFAHQRKCVVTESGQLLAVSPFITIDKNDKVVEKKVRFRTVGDMNCTAAIESEADTIEKVIKEITETKISERGATRLDDKISETGMEDRKRTGYF